MPHKSDEAILAKDTWGSTERCLQVFIASPSDVQFERNSVSGVIEEINRTLGQKIGLSLRIRLWEKFRPRGENVMDFIERQLKDCDLFVMIFSRKFGSSPSPNSNFFAGTEQEYDIASKLRDASGKRRPEIFTYFKRLLDNELLQDAGPQLAKVLEFKQRIQNSVFYREYTSAEMFPLELKDHLTEWMLDISQTLKFDEAIDYKRTILRKFFRLGAPQNRDPSALILFPGIRLRFPRVGRSEKLLRRRLLKSFDDITHLLPYMVLEDFQAIQKITKCLSIAGCDSVRSITTDVYQEHADREKNKLFICVPRSPVANDHLKNIANSGFEIKDANNRRKRKLIWENSTGKVEVKSPQSLFLKLQRAGDQNWRDNPGKCICVDFAVVARYPNPHANAEVGELSDLFFFGLRGLGTWGAAWYIDHRYDILAKRPIDLPNCRALLKVTFADNGIDDVVDVSECDQNFFDQQNSEDFIKANIRAYQRTGHSASQANL